MTSTTPQHHEVQHPQHQLVQPHLQPQPRPQVLQRTWETAPGAVAPGRPVEPAAVVSLVLGTVTLVAGCVPGLSLLALVGAVVAVVQGAVALRRLKTDEKTGRGLAITGLSCGSAAIAVAGVVSVLFLLWAAVMSGAWALVWGVIFL